MAFKIKTTAFISKDFSISKAVPAANKRFAEWLVDSVDPYVPYKSGKLSRSAKSNQNRLIYDTPYAHRLYFVGTIEYEAEHPEKRFDQGRVKYHFSRAVHSKAQSFWVWGSEKDNQEEWRRKIAEILLQEVHKTA